jgi:hypothetical protein
MPCKTLNVFNGSWSEKISMDRVHINILITEGIKFKVYPREEGIIHVFQAPCIVQEPREERNSKHELLLADIRNFSSPNM